MQPEGVPDALAGNPAADALRESDASLITGSATAFDETTIEIDPSRILDALRALKNAGFERLGTVTAVDYYPLEPRFAVVYHLQSVKKNLTARLKCRVGSDALEIDSATAVYRSANWYEREVFDLFGIVFRNHPNLKRIMMPDSWEGHPLRRDYPVHGHKYSYQHE